MNRTYYLLNNNFNKFFVDMSHSDTRLYVELNGLEIHVYNNSSLYSKLEEKFGLDYNIIPPDKLQVCFIIKPGLKCQFFLLKKNKIFRKKNAWSINIWLCEG